MLQKWIPFNFKFSSDAYFINEWNEHIETYHLKSSIFQLNMNKVQTSVKNTNIAPIARAQREFAGGGAV